MRIPTVLLATLFVFFKFGCAGTNVPDSLYVQEVLEGIDGEVRVQLPLTVEQAQTKNWTLSKTCWKGISMSFLDR